MSFVPIKLEKYVELHLKANPGTKRAELVARIEHALKAIKNGERCQCGQAIWVVGSAEAGLACFTCITGEVTPSEDYEIADACRESDALHQNAPVSG